MRIKSIQYVTLEPGWLEKQIKINETELNTMAKRPAAPMTAELRNSIINAKGALDEAYELFGELVSGDAKPSTEVLRAAYSAVVRAKDIYGDAMFKFVLDNYT